MLGIPYLLGRLRILTLVDAVRNLPKLSLDVLLSVGDPPIQDIVHMPVKLDEILGLGHAVLAKGVCMPMRYGG